MPGQTEQAVAGVKLDGRRIGAVMIGVVALLLLGGAVRLVLIETEKGEDLRDAAIRQQTTRQMLPALRGEILDARGRVLATTVRRPSVYVDPGMIKDKDVRYAACSVAPVLEMSARELEDLIVGAGKSRFVWVRRGISERAVEAFERVVAARNLEAFGLRYEVERVYPQGRVAPHVTGFATVDLVEKTHEHPAYQDLFGRIGIEGSYDETLAGVPGMRESTVDVIRRRVYAQSAKYDPPTDGATIILTIDSFIQQFTQEALRKAFEEHKPMWATAVVMDPHSGEVLAMASLPDFDPSDPFPAGFVRATDAERKRAKEVWRNCAVAFAYEPGSIFKPFVASSALNEGLVSIDEVFTINGPTRSFGRRTLHDTHAYHSLPVYEIISKSSNIGMGLIGARCGMDRLHQYVTAFGFGQRTGVALPGEHTGLVQRRERWNPLFSPQSIPMGQEIAVTSLQIVTGFSTFCNGGQLLRPRVIRGIVGPNGETLTDNSTRIVVRQVLEPEVADTFRHRALVQTVLNGTGRRAALPGYQVFGKTGTAQVAALEGGGYMDGQYTGSFVGGAPADDPRVAVIVSFYRPSGGTYYGGVVSAPVAKEIIAQTLTYLQVPRDASASASSSRRSGRAGRSLASM